MGKTFSRQLGLPGFELGDYIQESIDFLREHEPPEGYFVAFSGGKDSITSLELCKLAGVNFKAFYSCTRIDPPEVMRFIRKEYSLVQWLYPEQSFWGMVKNNGPPMKTYRYCCNELKKKPSTQIPLSNRIVGIRAEESHARAKCPRVDSYRKNQILLKPIFHWPEWAVWEFIEAFHFPYPALYDEGWSRIGCVVCPFILGPGENAQRRIALYQKRWPGMWKCLKLASIKWFAKTVTDRRANQKFTDFDDFWKTYLRGGISEKKIEDIPYGRQGFL